MSVLLSKATGNFLTAGTWALVDSASYSNSETGVSAPPNTSGATSRSSAFTPAASTIDAVALKLANRSGTTGTVTVAIILSSDNSVQKTVTINASDLPAATSTTLDGGWIVFAFGSGLVVNGSTAYKIDVITSLGSASFFRDAVANNWSRALRTTTTQAPVAGDDLIVAGEHTGAGAGNSFTVTMDQTAATDYGSNTTSLVTPALAICKRGTLKFKDTSAANPYLRLSGYCIVYNGGTLNCGVTGGSEIPRDSTAVLEFDCAADGDFGLVVRNGGIYNSQGLSRTSGKNVVACKLNVDTSVNLMQASSLNSSALTAAAATTALDPTGTSLGVSAAIGGFNQLIGATDTAANTNHFFRLNGSVSVTGVTQVCTVWVKRGSGTNNRHVRLQLGTTATVPATNGFYSDFDLQAITAGTCTAIGNGTATSAAITAFGGGFICTIIGKISSGSATPIALIAACNAAAGITYLGDATQNFICSWPQVYTAASQPTTLNVDTDTGWLAGDVAAIASTTRTHQECEVVKLGSDATSTTLPLSLYPVNFRSGSGVVQNTATLTIASPCVVSGNKDAFNGNEVYFTTTGALPTGVTASTKYYVINRAADGSHQIAATPGGAAINTTGSQSGVHTANQSCFQAEIVLLTRNVKVRGVSNTAMTFVQIQDGAIVDVDWTEFYYIGENASGKRGIEVRVTGSNAHNFSINNSSIHDTEDMGFWYDSGPTTLTTAEFSNNTMWNMSTISGPACSINGAITSTGWVFDSNVMIHAAGNQNGWTLADVGGTFTNNVVVGAGQHGISLAEAASIGTFSGNISHSNQTAGLLQAGAIGTCGTFYGWRNNGNGELMQTNIQDLSMEGHLLVGNNVDNFLISIATAIDIKMSYCVLSADTTFAVTNGLRFGTSGAIYIIEMDNCDFGTANGVKAAHTGDIVVNATMHPRISARNTKMASATEVSTTAGTMQTNSFVTSQNHDQTAGNHKTWMKNGIVQTDTSIFNTASPSMKMTPNSASLKLESATQFRGKLFKIDSGASITVAASIRKSAAGDGAAYTGSQPRLIARANPGIGINVDTVLATYSASTGSWNEISGATPTATDDGAVEVVVDCDGTAGFINVDDFRKAA